MANNTHSIDSSVDNSDSNSDHNIIDAQINQRFNCLQLIIDESEAQIGDNCGTNAFTGSNGTDMRTTDGNNVAVKSVSQSVPQNSELSAITGTGGVSGVTELPNQISSAFLSDDSFDSSRGEGEERVSSVSYRELSSSVDTSALSCEQRTDVWTMNYNESAIYLEEGLNNDKFDYHPRSRSSLPAYLMVHNHWFYCLDLMATLLLLCLALLEKPAVDGLKVNEGIHASLELLALSVVAIELFMKYRWMKSQHFIRHTRTAMKSVVLLIMICEALVVLIRRDSHFRVTRALRPVFLIDNHYCGGIRRVVRQILQSLPPFIDMLVLLFFFMLVFAILGFYLFSANNSDPYFSTIGRSFVSLFVLLTTANFPDVMMPSYERNRMSSLFFIAFLIINLYFLMNIMLAVVYEAFTRIEKEKFRKLLLHRRKACRLAFGLLVTQKTPQKISFKHFEGLMKYYKPSANRLERYLMFKALDTNRCGFVTLNEFYNVYEVSELKWEAKYMSTQWFCEMENKCCKRFCRLIYRLVAHKWFDVLVYLMIGVSAVYQLVEAIVVSASKSLSPMVESRPLSLIFVSLYGLEASLKLIGFGLIGYFNSGWNRFDFSIACLAIIGLMFGDACSLALSVVFVLRSIRLLQLLQHRRRYKDILGAFMFIIVKRFVSLSIVVLIVYYNFAIIGMELFSTYDLTNCCKNTTLEQYFAYNCNSTLNGFYYLNNFSDIITSYVTLFELMVVNNWFILMDGYALITSDWSRLYFMTFYIMTLVVITIVVALVLETFLFRIQYRHKMGDIDKDTMITMEVMLTDEELSFCCQQSSHVQNISQVLQLGNYFFHSHSHSSTTNTINTINGYTGLIYKGMRARTKFSLSLNMYCEEIVVWTQMADQQERQEMQEQSHEWRPRKRRITRRTLSCTS